MTLDLPANFSARPAIFDDLDEVVRLMNAVTQAAAGRSDNTVFTVGRYWKGGDVKLEIDTLLIRAPDGRLAGFAQFMEEKQPAPCDADSWVHPAFADGPVGEALLRWIDRRAGEAKDARVEIEHCYVYTGDRATRSRLEKAGYGVARVFRRMTVDMAGPPPEPVLPQGILIRPFRRGAEERAVYEAFEEAQADEWGHEASPFDKWLYYFIEVEEAFDPAAWLLAVEGDAIAGYALCRWERPGEPESGTVRYLGVREHWRKRGIALALLRAAFGAMYRRGKRGAGLGVDATSLTGADRLYERAGMRVAAETLFYRKILREG
jgi:mycothiol synthase